ncbi:MAG: hypothetical protein ABIO72_01020 [Patescibacteria group bacterium]
MRIQTFLLPIVALSLVGAGCNPIENLKEKAMNGIVDKAIEHTVKTQTGKDVDVNIKDGGMQVTGEDGANFAMGENLKLPDNFPSDIPVYGSVSIKSSSIDTKKGSVFLIMSSKDKAEDIVAWYKEQAKAKGWTQKSSLEMSEGNYIVSFENKDKATFAITITQGEDEEETGITLTRSETQQ